MNLMRIVRQLRVCGTDSSHKCFCIGEKPVEQSCVRIDGVFVWNCVWCSEVTQNLPWFFCAQQVFNSASNGLPHAR